MPITNQGIESLLRVTFLGQAHPASPFWFLGFIADTNFTGISVTDTMTSHSGWEEFTDYEVPPTQSANQRRRITIWTGSFFAPAAIQRSAFNNVIDGPLIITRPVAKIRGWFVTSGSQKLGTAGILYTVGLFDFNIATNPIYQGDEVFPRFQISLRADATIES